LRLPAYAWIPVRHRRASLLVVCLSREDAEWLAGRQHRCSGHLPPSKRLINKSIAVQECSSSPERQVVYYIALHPVAHVEVGVAVIRLWVIGLLPIRRAATAAPSGRILIVKEVRPHIAPLKTQPGRKPFVDRDLQRVVVGNSVIRASGNRPELLIRTIGRAVIRANVVRRNGVEVRVVPQVIA